jgi:hypothetical protein
VKFYLKAKAGHAMSFRQQRKRNKEKRKQEKKGTQKRTGKKLPAQRFDNELQRAFPRAIVI